jgi:hypothetical protein
MQYFQTFLLTNNVSKATSNDMLNYFRGIWELQKGVHYPKFINEAPTVLLEQLKLSIYGKHFKNVKNKLITLDKSRINRSI